MTFIKKFRIFVLEIKNSAYKTFDSLPLEWIGISKNPSTDPMKKSRAGYFQVIKEDSEIKTIQFDPYKQDTDLLCPVFKNGDILKDITFDEIRKLVDSQL